MIKKGEKNIKRGKNVSIYDYKPAFLKYLSKLRSYLINVF